MALAKQISDIQDVLAAHWNSRGPADLWEHLDTLSHDTLKSLVMLNVGARAAARNTL